ncbi:MAG: hypothetical protein V1738_02465 [Patescibacteria group bacterium]
MLGLIISGLYFLYLAFLDGAASTEVAYLQATGFLYDWYWVTSFILVIIGGVYALFPLFVLNAVGAIIGNRVGGALLGSVIGGLGGLAAGAAVTVYIPARIVLRRAMFIGGAYLLMTAGNSSLEFGQFEIWRLGVGAALILVALVMRKAGNNSSSSSSGS